MNFSLQTLTTPLARRIARWSAERLDSGEYSSRYREEYLANLDLVPGGTARLVAAVGYAVNVPRMQRTLGLERPAPVRCVVIGMPDEHEPGGITGGGR
jgi:hypothetical protein